MASESCLARIRAYVVIVLLAMTMWANMSAAQAQVLNYSHMSHGETALPDGGWATCVSQAELCSSAPESDGEKGMLGLHHHHYGDSQFSALAPDFYQDCAILDRLGVFGPSNEPAVKTAAASSADQPPKV